MEIGNRGGILLQVDTGIDNLTLQEFEDTGNREVNLKGTYIYDVYELRKNPYGGTFVVEVEDRYLDAVWDMLEGEYFDVRYLNG